MGQALFLVLSLLHQNRAGVEIDVIPFNASRLRNTTGSRKHEGGERYVKRAGVSAECVQPIEQDRFLDLLLELEFPHSDGGQIALDLQKQVQALNTESVIGH